MWARGHHVKSCALVRAPISHSENLDWVCAGRSVVMSVSTDVSTVGVVSEPRSTTGKLSSGKRWFSLIEFLIGGAIVIGHNVYHALPNEVPILFVLGMISVRLRNGSWAAMGLSWPASWRKTILIALAAATIRILLSAVVIDPVTAHFWPPAIAPGGMNEISGHLLVALRWLLLV